MSTDELIPDVPPKTREEDRKDGEKWVRDLSRPEPPPVKSERVAVWDLVIGDMQARDNAGYSKYGTRLQPFNGRDPLVDAYQEALDLVVYLRQAIFERDAK